MMIISWFVLVDYIWCEWVDIIAASRPLLEIQKSHYMVNRGPNLKENEPNRVEYFFAYSTQGRGVGEIGLSVAAAGHTIERLTTGPGHRNGIKYPDERKRTIGTKKITASALDLEWRWGSVVDVTGRPSCISDRRLMSAFFSISTRGGRDTHSVHSPSTTRTTCTSGAKEIEASFSLTRL